MVVANQKQKRPLNCCNSSTARCVSEHSLICVQSIRGTSGTQEVFSLHLKDWRYCNETLNL